MKKLFLSTLIILSLLIAIPAHAIVTYNCTSWSGGTSRALDYISVSDLNNGDRALIVFTSGVSSYLGMAQYDSSGTTAENTSSHPYFVRPDDYTSSGVWVEIPLSWVDLQTTLIISNLTVTGTNSVVNLDASGRLSGALLETGVTTGTNTISGVSQRGGIIHNLEADSEVTCVLTSATKGDSAIFILAKDMIGGSTMWVQIPDTDQIINSVSFKTGTGAGTSYYYLSSAETSGITGEGISLISPADGKWYVYEERSPTQGSK